MHNKDNMDQAILDAVAGRNIQPNAANDRPDRRALKRYPSEQAYIEAKQKQLDASSTVYVGNLGFLTSEDLVMRHFSQCGAVRAIFMGLNALTRKPCGFAFVEYESRTAALIAVNALNGSTLDDGVIRVSMDVGRLREDQRFWGRGITGGQVRDQVRSDVDLRRGGLGLRDAAAMGLQAVSLGESGEHAALVYSWESTPTWILKLQEQEQQQQEPDRNQSSRSGGGGQQNASFVQKNNAPARNARR